MKIKRLQTLCGLILAISFQACNPDCETLPSSNIIVPMGPFEQGTELMISSNPPDLLEGRSFSMSLRSNNQSEIVPLETRYERGLGAAIVQLPDELNANATILIDDPDCTGNLIPIGTSTGVVNASFFVDNPFFITPTPPLVIIPAPPIAPPLKVINAWFSPNNRDYCIWFKPDEDADGNEKSNLIPAEAISPTTIINGPPNGSAELAVGCGGTPATDRFYHANPVSGIIDKENNYIKIRIDRTAKGFGIEELEGQFIHPDQLAGTGYDIGGVCEADPAEGTKTSIMLLTSLQTGRQMILWRGVN